MRFYQNYVNKKLKMRKLVSKLFQNNKVKDVQSINNERFAFSGIGQFYHTDFILEIVKLTNCKKYLELGINDAATIGKVSKYVDQAVGVDIEKRFNGNLNFTFYKGTTDQFFKKTLNYSILYSLMRIIV